MDTLFETPAGTGTMPLAPPATTQQRHLDDGLKDAAMRIRFDGTIIDADDGIDDVLGLSPHHLVDTSVFRLIYECDWMPVFRGVVDIAEEREQEVHVGLRVRTAAGSWRLVGATLRALRDGPALAGVLLVLHPLLNLLT